MLLIGPLFAACGVWVFVVAVVSWRNPKSKIVTYVTTGPYATWRDATPFARFFGYYREKREPQQLWSMRILGVPIGIIFFATGCFMTYTQVRCAIDLGNPLLLFTPLIGPLKIRLFPPMLVMAIPMLLLAGVIVALQRSSRQQTRSSIWSFLFIAVWLFCSFEAASFHVGVMANRWAALGLVFFLLIPAVMVASWFRLRWDRRREASGLPARDE